MIDGDDIVLRRASAIAEDKKIYSLDEVAEKNG